MSKSPVAFLGLGIMGSGMARRLLEAGFPLTVFNRTRKKSIPLAARGAKVAASPGEAATGAAVVVSMVADDAASRSMWLGKQGALAAIKRGTLLVECSTLSVGWVRELAVAAKKRGCELLDAPVTGSRTHAASGGLNFLVGGSGAALKRARPALSVMGRSITHVGPIGSGALLKLINNFLCGVQAVSLAEAIAMIERSGLDRDKSLDLLVNGTPGSPLFKILSSRMVSSDYTPNFLLSLMAKDLTYALAEGRQQGIPMATVSAALDCFKGAAHAGRSNQDFSAVIEQFRRT